MHLLVTLLIIHYMHNACVNSSDCWNSLLLFINLFFIVLRLVKIRLYLFRLYFGSRVDCLRQVGSEFLYFTKLVKLRCWGHSINFKLVLGFG